MVAKELNLAMAAYNLVRAVTCVAAQKAGLPPRAYSPLIAAASSPEQAKNTSIR